MVERKRELVCLKNCMGTCKTMEYRCFQASTRGDFLLDQEDKASNFSQMFVNTHT